MMSDSHTDPIGQMKAVIEGWKKPPLRWQVAHVFEPKQFSDVNRLLNTWKETNLADCPWPESQQIHIAVAGFGTLNYIKPYVEIAALADGAVPEVTLGNYNQLYQELSNSVSPILKDDVKLLWIWVDLEDILPAEFCKNRKLLLTKDGLQQTENAVQEFCTLIEKARENFNGFILINNFVQQSRSPFGIADSKRQESQWKIYAIANELLYDRIGSVEHALVFPLDYHLGRFGLANAVEYKLKLMADCRYRPEFYYYVSQKIRPYLRNIQGTIKKVLVLDLDNTLWGGVVGEDGWQNVKIAPDSPTGKAHMNFQKAILELFERGVILAINSKNNYDDVKELFEQREDMVLSFDHFACMQINWNDKATNCRRIAEEINVGIDSLVFWDDNPSERALVKELAGQVYVVDVPGDAAKWADYLMELDLFDPLEISAEDSRRGVMYAEERKRRDYASTVSDVESFLQSLDLKVNYAKANKKNIPRIVSLLSRTNQFNLTTRRHGEATIQKWANDDRYAVVAYAAEDRFGSYGIVGVTILKKDGGNAVIDSLLLSCRAMAKGIENVMLSVIAEQARAWNCKDIKGVFIPTKKNAPIKEFLPQNGFEIVDESETKIEYKLPVHKTVLDAPEYVTITND